MYIYLYIHMTYVHTCYKQRTLQGGHLPIFRLWCSAAMADRVIIKNLDFGLVNSQKLVKLFHGAGFQGVEDGLVHISRSGRISHEPGKMCVAFVTLASDKEVTKAIERFHGRTVPEIAMVPISVQKAVPRMSTLRSSTKSSAPALQPEISSEAAPGSSENPVLRAEDIYTDPSMWTKKKKKDKSKKQSKHEQDPMSHSNDVVLPAEPPWKRRQRLRDDPCDNSTG